MKKQKQKKRASSMGKEKVCKHQWASLMAQRGKKVVAVPSAKICIKCGLLQIGSRTIRISRSRLDMGSLPIKSAGKVLINTDGRLKVPVGENRYD